VSLLQVESAPRSRTSLQLWALWVYLAALVSLCSLQAALGALPTRVYAHDFFMFLDGAWRLANGQIPFVDFYAGYGVLIWNPLRWGLALHGYNADGIGLARAFYTAFIGVWFLLLTRLAPRRVQSMTIGLFILMFVSAARPLGEYPTWVSHAMFYNRVGYALLFLIIFEQLGVSRFDAADHALTEQPHDKGRFWRGASTGAALGCATLVNIWFVLPGAVLLVIGLLLFGVHRRHLAGILAGAAAAFVFAITCLHFRPMAFLHEMVTLAHQRGSITGGALTTLVEDIGEVVFTLAAGLAIAHVRFVNRHVSRKYVLATVVIAGCDIFCRATNSIRADLPLAAFWCLSAAILLLSSPAAAESATARRQGMIALLVLCPMAMPIFLMDAASSVYAAYKTAAIRNHTSSRFDSARLRNWVPQDWTGENPNYVTRNGQPLILATNDGIQLLRNLSRQDETVFCIAYDNPFSFALGRRPAEGGALWLYEGNNFSIRHPLPEYTAIGHPDLLMVEQPNYVEGNTTKAILSLYPDLLTKEFAFAGSSQYWTLYRRRSLFPR
jgi:hypothetical protein